MNQATSIPLRKPSIVPFWDRLPSFFLFPLLPANLMVLVALALGSLLTFVLPVPSPIDFVLAEALVWITALRHAFGVMDMTSSGRITVAAQQAHFEKDPDRVNLPWKMIAIFMVWGILISMVERMSETLGWGANVFFTLATPAILMQLSASNDLGSSLNPGTWISYMRAIGMPYGALCFFLFMLLTGAPIALGILIPLLGETIALSALNFVCLYFNLIMFYMMGYVMYQYHDVLGLPATVLFEEATTADADEPSTDAMIAARLAAGQMEEAIVIAKNAVRNEPQNIPAQERLYKLLITAGQADKAKQQGIRLFSLCLAQAQAARAVGLYRDLSVGAEPLVLAPEQILPLAKLATKERDFKLALELVRGFDKRFPGHADIPAVYFLSAQLLSEQFRQNDMARNILEAMLKRYPEHALATEAGHYLEVLKRMMASEAK
ncbi:MAG TPA: tetratricopeptide repeat protein [Rhodocyclaceae bacterium]|nr:tetratricopeptide repeat protein [Rhodocyclaceae bacterium]